MENFHVTSRGDIHSIQAHTFTSTENGFIFYDASGNATHYLSEVTAVMPGPVDTSDRSARGYEGPVDASSDHIGIVPARGPCWYPPDRVKRLCDLLRAAASHIPDSSLTGSIRQDIAAALEDMKL